MPRHPQKCHRCPSHDHGRRDTRKSDPVGELSNSVYHGTLHENIGGAAPQCLGDVDDLVNNSVGGRGLLQMSANCPHNCGGGKCSVKSDPSSTW